MTEFKIQYRKLTGETDNIISKQLTTSVNGFRQRIIFLD